MRRTVKCSPKRSQCNCKPRTQCNCYFKSTHTGRSFKFYIAVSLCLPSSRQNGVSLSPPQTAVCSPQGYHTCDHTNAVRAPAVNLTDVCTGTYVSKCKKTYVHLFTLEDDIFLNDGVHFTLETKFKGTFFKRQLNVSSFAFFLPA